MKAWLKGGLIGISITSIIHFIWFGSLFFIHEAEMPGLGAVLIPAFFIFSIVPFFVAGVILGLIIPKIHEHVKNYTLSGGITGGLICIASSVLLSAFILIIGSLKELYLNLKDLGLLIISGIIIGAIIGFIVGKVKSHKEEASMISNMTQQKSGTEQTSSSKGGLLHKIMVIIALIFFALQLFTRPFLGNFASLFGYIGGLFCLLGIISYFVSRNNNNNNNNNNNKTSN